MKEERKHNTKNIKINLLKLVRQNADSASDSVFLHLLLPRVTFTFEE